MKKLMFLMALLVIASPTLSKVIVSVDEVSALVPEWDPNLAIAEVNVLYDVNGHDTVRAFALDIEVSGPCEPVIDWAWRVPEEDHPYWVTPSNIVIEDGAVADEGDVILFDDSPGVPEGAVTVEMGSLYEEGEDSPADSGSLFNAEIWAAEGTTIEVCISENAMRGGVVLEDGSSPGLSSECLTIELPSAYDGCFPLDHPDWDEWDSVGRPDSWCCDTQCHGDADCASEQVGWDTWQVAYNDFDILADNWLSNPTSDPNLGADFSHSTEQVGWDTWRVAYDDFDILSENWLSNPDPNCLDVP